jgi:hypothetical protein
LITAPLLPHVYPIIVGCATVFVPGWRFYLPSETERVVWRIAVSHTLGYPAMSLWAPDKQALRMPKRRQTRSVVWFHVQGFFPVKGSLIRDYTGGAFLDFVALHCLLRLPSAETLVSLWNCLSIFLDGGVIDYMLHW